MSESISTSAAGALADSSATIHQSATAARASGDISNVLTDKTDKAANRISEIVQDVVGKRSGNVAPGVLEAIARKNDYSKLDFLRARFSAVSSLILLNDTPLTPGLGPVRRAPAEYPSAQKANLLMTASEEWMGAMETMHNLTEMPSFGRSMTSSFMKADNAVVGHAVDRSISLDGYQYASMALPLYVMIHGSFKFIKRLW